MKFIFNLLNFVFPVSCLGCKSKSVIVCDSCLSGIPLLEHQVCPLCRRKSEFGAVCFECLKDSGRFGERFFFDNLIVCSRYDKNGLLKKLIERFKYKYSEELGGALGGILVRQMRCLNNFFDQVSGSVGEETGVLAENFFFVPVPLHKKRLKDRGFNQAGLLSSFVAQAFGVSVFKPLVRVINTTQQAHLDREGRLKNLKNAFSIKRGFESQIKGKSIILVDDVCTTGSTLNECSKILKNAGVKKIIALVLARGDAR